MTIWKVSLSTLRVDHFYSRQTTNSMKPPKHRTVSLESPGRSPARPLEFSYQVTRFEVRILERRRATGPLGVSCKKLSAQGEAAKTTSAEVAKTSPGSASPPATNTSYRRARGASGGSLWSDGSLIRVCHVVKHAILAPSVAATRPGKTKKSKL